MNDLIRRFEGLSLTAYPDPGTGAEPYTIGYGHTKFVAEGDTCTLEQAEQWLDEDILECVECLKRNVSVPLNQNQFDALISFVFNVGCGAFSKSTLLQYLNKGLYKDAADQLLRWNKAGGNVMPGLEKRREAERILFIQEPKMAPLAVSILTSAIPALLNKVPELLGIMSDKTKELDDRRVEAVAKAATVMIEATKSNNVQEAIEKVQTDPQAAQAANEALRLNRAEIMDLIERAWDADEKSVAEARVFHREDKPVIGKWQFVHILSLILILFGGIVAGYVVGWSEDATERAMALQTLLLVGFASVVAFWLGSSRSSQLKDLWK